MVDIKSSGNDLLDAVTESVLESYETAEERGGSRLMGVAKIKVDAEEAEALLDELGADKIATITETKNVDKIDTLGRPVSVYFEVSE